MAENTHGHYQPNYTVQTGNVTHLPHIQNTSSGVNIIQIWGGQRQKGLGDFYRKHNVIK